MGCQVAFQGFIDARQCLDSDFDFNAQQEAQGLPPVVREENAQIMDQYCKNLFKREQNNIKGCYALPLCLDSTPFYPAVEEDQKIHLLGHMCCKSCFGFADYVIKNDICNEAADQINSLLGYNDEVDSVDSSYYKEQIAKKVFDREVDNKFDLESEFVEGVAEADDSELDGVVFEQEISVKPAAFKDVPPPNLQNL